MVVFYNEIVFDLKAMGKIVFDRKVVGKLCFGKLAQSYILASYIVFKKKRNL